MAGAGYKLFATGDVLTAAQVNTYLNEQTVMVFADSAARTTALSGVLAEGMVSYLQDTNAVEVYNGSAWVGVGNVGDITAVQAGVGISVASGTGPIPVITNSSTDLITTAGDLLYGTAADTVARLGIGAAGRVLKVNSGATAPEWAVDPTTDVVTTAGDLIYGTAADTVARLGIGTAGQVLQVNSGATAPEWAAAAGGFNYGSATVATEQTTTSATFTDLTTVGPAVTVTTGTTAILILKGIVDNEASGRAASMGFAISGATTVSAAAASALSYRNDGGRGNISASVVIPITGLTAGSNTFTAKYVSLLGGLVSFSNRQMIVIY
jgi:hypothetical protein